MRLTSFSRAGILALSALSVLFTAPAGAKDGRDFAGHYSLTDAIEKGSQVELTLTLQLFNYSGADLKQAVVTVQQPPPVPGVLANFASIKLWRSGSDVVVSQQLTIPQDEYKRWSTRVQPAVFIGYSDEEGHAYLRSAQLRRLPIIREAVSVARPAPAR
ncbi:MAG TPA: hypothetical protein VN924_21215 [Bryobacteraceae bacterium]|jgi:hypothetical protein|nr:hypothetical protein [Bryobacteraceae bacterium]